MGPLKRHLCKLITRSTHSHHYEPPRLLQARCQCRTIRSLTVSPKIAPWRYCRDSSQCRPFGGVATRPGQLPLEGGRDVSYVSYASLQTFWCCSNLFSAQERPWTRMANLTRNVREPFDKRPRPVAAERAGTWDSKPTVSPCAVCGAWPDATYRWLLKD